MSWTIKSINRTTVGPVLVSTIFVPDLVISNYVVPGYYETMVFGSDQAVNPSIRTEFYYKALKDHFAFVREYEDEQYRRTTEALGREAREEG